MKSRFILLCIILLYGCGKNEIININSETNNLANADKMGIIIVKKQEKERAQTNTYKKLKVESADYDEIANKIAAIESKRDLDVKLAEYAEFMKKKKPFQGTVKLERITCSCLTGPPVPGRILTDDDIATLCRGNEEKISRNLFLLIAACMGYTHGADKKAAFEDGEALLRYLIQHGTPEVQAEAKDNMATLITQTVDRQDEAMRLFNEAISEMKTADMDIKKIIAAEVDRVSVYIYMDDPEGMETAAKNFYETYKENESQEYFWEKMMEMYWTRIKTWRGVDNEYALELCRKAIETENEFAVNSCKRWGIKDMYGYIEKDVDNQ